MTVINCDTCGTSIDVTAKSVALPFECLPCAEGNEDFGGQTYEDMAPKTETVTFPAAGTYSWEEVPNTNVVSDKDISMEEVLGADVEDIEVLDPLFPEMSSDEFATVENTTRLIDDLEAQLESAQRGNESLREQLQGVAKDNLDLQEKLLAALAETLDATTLLNQVRAKLEERERYILILTGMLKGVIAEIA